MWNHFGWHKLKFKGKTFIGLDMQQKVVHLIVLAWGFVVLEGSSGLFRNKLNMVTWSSEAVLNCNGSRIILICCGRNLSESKDQFHNFLNFYWSLPTSAENLPPSDSKFSFSLVVLPLSFENVKNDWKWKFEKNCWNFFLTTL